ncbi:neuropeptide B isoform X1 [Tamandua tetradactyla]|uniref:neuropeptide B isoform X1 n=1 Tax=Tamandua tetradactyla TaxID=48850 RepID=UPI00405463A2
MTNTRFPWGQQRPPLEAAPAQQLQRHKGRAGWPGYSIIGQATSSPAPQEPGAVLLGSPAPGAQQDRPRSPGDFSLGRKGRLFQGLGSVGAVAGRAALRAPRRSRNHGPSGRLPGAAPQPAEPRCVR